MKMELDVELRDVPGQLSFVLDRVTEHGGNIESVVHHRQDARGEWVPVRIVFEVAPMRAHRLVEALKERVRVLSASGEKKGHPMAFLLVGHVFDNHIDDYLEGLYESGCRVHRVQAEVTGKSAPSAVFIDITGDDEAAVGRAVDTLERLSAERDILLVRGLPEVA